MTDQEKSKRIEELRDELRKLEAVPRNDWHKAFEAFLNIRISRYEGVELDKEVEVGVDPPRIDFIILVNDGTAVFEESIFKLFRKVNIIEYKSQDDSLNEDVLYKACGYAGMYISTTAHKTGVSRDDVTISVFRTVKNKRLFSDLEKAGRLTKTDTPGIYHVSVFWDIPFQIIITSELEGPEYAACRVIAAEVQEADVQQVVNSSYRTDDGNLKDYYRDILSLLANNHRRLLQAVIRRTDMSTDALLDILHDDIEKIVEKRVEQKMKDKDEQLAQERKAADERLAQVMKAADERLTQQMKATDEQTSSHIRDLMDAYHISIGEAMDVLKIPQSRREYFSENILRDA